MKHQGNVKCLKDIYMLDFLEISIDWGHPNTRNGNLKDYNRGREQAWAREHQLKVSQSIFK